MSESFGRDFSSRLKIDALRMSLPSYALILLFADPEKNAILPPGMRYSRFPVR
jgi:hypothetical protein